MIHPDMIQSHHFSFSQINNVKSKTLYTFLKAENCSITTATDSIWWQRHRSLLAL